MRVYKRAGSPYYFVDLSGPDGKRVRKSTKEKNKAAAIKVASEMVAEAKEQRSRPGDPIRLKVALDRYIDALKGDKKPWARSAEMLRHKIIGERPDKEPKNRRPWSARWHLDPDMMLDAITPTDIADLVRARQKEGMAAATIAREVSVLTATVTLCRKLRFKVPDTADWDSPKPAQKTRYLSAEEYRRLYDYLGDDVPRLVKGRALVYRQDCEMVEQRREARDMLVALAFTGARWGEMAALTWDRVNFARGEVRLFGTKTDQERIVPLPGELRTVLQRRYETRDRAQPLVFPGPVSGSCRSRVSDSLRDAMDVVGLNRPDIVERYGKATAHSLRHTYASWLIQNGADLSEVQKALGHSSINMTLRYAHLRNQRTVDRLRAVLDAASADVTVKRHPCQETPDAEAA